MDLNPQQPLAVVAYLPGSSFVIAQTSDGHLGLVDVRGLSFHPMNERQVKASVLKYGYQRLEPRPAVPPTELEDWLKSMPVPA